MTDLKSKPLPDIPIKKKAYTIGQRVQCKDEADEDWLEGTVDSVDPLRVLVDGDEKSFQFDAVRPVKTSPPPLSELPTKAYKIGQRVQCKDEADEDWLEGTVDSVDPLRVLVDGDEKSFQFDAVRPMKTSPPPLSELPTKAPAKISPPLSEIPSKAPAKTSPPPLSEIPTKAPAKASPGPLSEIPKAPGKSSAQPLSEIPTKAPAKASPPPLSEIPTQPSETPVQPLSEIPTKAPAKASPPLSEISSKPSSEVSAKAPLQPLSEIPTKAPAKQLSETQATETLEKPSSSEMSGGTLKASAPSELPSDKAPALAFASALSETPTTSGPGATQVKAQEQTPTDKAQTPTGKLLEELSTSSPVAKGYPANSPPLSSAPLKTFVPFGTAEQTAPILQASNNTSSAASKAASDLLAQAEALLQPKKAASVGQPNNALSAMQHASALSAAAFVAVQPKAIAKKKTNVKVINKDRLTPGIYNTADGQAFGSLVACVKPDNHYMFMVTTMKALSTQIQWGADAMPAPAAPEGHELAGKDTWLLVGHELEGSVFVINSTDPPSVYECDKDFNVRTVWNYSSNQNEKIFSGAAAPPIRVFPTENFLEAIVDKDPDQNELFSPSTQTIIEACCYTFEPLPTEPKARQQKLVSFYTAETPLYHEMNAALRNDDLMKMRYFSAYIKELRDVFKTDHVNQIITPFEGKVWRGISFPDPQQALNEFQVDHVFSWPAFTSMTTNGDVAKGFGNLVFEITCQPPAGTYDDDNPEYAPASVCEWSQFKGEAEILFPPNVQFIVRRIDFPSPDNGLSSPLVVCETIAFDSDTGLSKFSDISQTIKSVVDQEDALWKTVKKHKDQLTEHIKQSKEVFARVEQLESRIDDLESSGGGPGASYEKYGSDCDEDECEDDYDEDEDDCFKASRDKARTKDDFFIQQFPSLATKMSSMQKEMTASLKGGSLSDEKLDNEFARELAEEIDQQLAKELTAQMNKEMHREMAKEVARKCARVMAKKMGRDIREVAKSLVKNQMQEA